MPLFGEDASALAAAAAKLSPKRLGALMHISPALAELNAARFRSFSDQPQRPALFAFAGDVYIGLEAYSLNEDAIRFAQDHVRILSGLYGLLRPLDTIRPYRLEMGTGWAPGRKKNLYQYWGGRIAGALLHELAAQTQPTIVNLASKEYWAAVAPHLPAGTRVIDIDFREQTSTGSRFVSFAAKRARGMMARYICEHHLREADALKAFDSDHYAFDAENSDERRWCFIRATATA